VPFPGRSAQLRLEDGALVLVVDDSADRGLYEPIRIEIQRQPPAVVLHAVTRSEPEQQTFSLVQHADRFTLTRDDDAELASIAWDADREDVVGAGIVWPNRLVPGEIAGEAQRPVDRPAPRAVVVTRIAPPHPVLATYRFRFLAENIASRTVDVPVQPETALEHTIAGFGGVVALARPLPLVLASYAAAAPRDVDNMASWWWLDPWFGGRRMTGWLVAALVLAALLAWWARRQALRRCATTRAVHFWTAVAVLLGPLGVIWMRLTVPWAVVEPVGDGVRAVDRDATPQNDAPWPAPAAVGTEVFAS
jgi:hypothetical protein